MVLKILPDEPTVVPLFTSEKYTADKFVKVPFDCEVQFIPPFVVLSIVEDSPTTVPLNESENEADIGTVVGISGTILRTTNGGTNWISQSSGTIEYLRDVSFSDANIGTVVGSVGTILRTSNGGTNWISQSSGTTEQLWGVSFADANVGTAVGENGTILRTTNGGINWVSQNGTNNHLYDVSFTETNIGTVVGYFGAILRTQNGGVAIVNLISSKIPEKFLLSQNYPNPFNPVTKIKFDITRDLKPETQNIRLTIFNSLGKKVTTLVDQRLSPGVYEVEFDGTTLASGIYFYKLEVEGFVQTKSMMLIK